MLLQKYGTASVYNATALRNNSSTFWRTLFPHFQVLISMSHWQVGKGDIPFRGTNWCGEVFNMEVNTDLMVYDGLQNFHQVEYLFTEAQRARVPLVELAIFFCTLALGTSP